MVLAAVIGLAVTYALTPPVRDLARRLGVEAHPGGRRVHARSTPLMGGLAIYAGFAAAVIAAVAVSPDLRLDSQVAGMLIGGTFVSLVGLLDDKYELPGWAQALSIIVGGVILVAFGIKVLYVTNPFRGGHLLWLGWLSGPVTVLWVLMVTKAVDCMDGLDGLAAGISAIASGTLMIMALSAGAAFRLPAVMSAALLGSALGFLRFNYPPAKLFMGTIGAQFLGFTLAGISIMGAFKMLTLVAVAAPVLVLGVPLFDTAFVVLRRALTGRKIHEADKSHLHHRLIDRGLSHRQAIWFIYALTFVLCAAAYALFRSASTG